MVAARINGFVNGRKATGKVFSMSIYNRSNVPAKKKKKFFLTNQNRERGAKIK